MKIFGKKCSYCRSRFANHINRKIHETMMHKEKLIRDGKYNKPISTTPNIGSVECVIESDNNDGHSSFYQLRVPINPTKKYPKGKVYVWSHIHEYCKRDPCLFCGRGDLTEIKREWGIKDDESVYGE